MITLLNALGALVLGLPIAGVILLVICYACCVASGNEQRRR